MNLLTDRFLFLEVEIKLNFSSLSSSVFFLTLHHPSPFSSHWIHLSTILEASLVPLLAGSGIKCWVSQVPLLRLSSGLLLQLHVLGHELREKNKAMMFFRRHTTYFTRKFIPGTNGSQVITPPCVRLLKKKSSLKLYWECNSSTKMTDKSNCSLRYREIK